ncbi:MAG: n-acetylglutamate synthase [Bacteroidota bacterium]
MNYHNKTFRPIQNSSNGEVTEETLFEYKQEGNILPCTYQGDRIIKGHLIGVVDQAGNIDMRYHQVNQNGSIMTGICHSTPKVMKNGKLRLYENWQWTSGDKSKGTSILEEV